MKVRTRILTAIAAIWACLATPYALSEDTFTDAEVTRALSTIQVPKGQRPPTLEEFRSMTTMDHNGKVRASTLEEFRSAYQFSMLPYSLAQRFYPKVLTDQTSPDGLTLAFLLKDRSGSSVLKHGAAAVHEQEGSTLAQTLEQIIPGTHLPSRVEQGSQCFAQIPGERSKFCVIYAVLP